MNYPLIRRYFLLGVTIVLVSLLETLSEGQSSARVQLRINQEAANLIKLAQEAARSGNWVQTVKNYQEVLEKYPDYLIPDPSTNPGEFIYVGAKYFVEKQLANLPEEGRQTYQALFDPAARAIFPGWLNKSTFSGILTYSDLVKLHEIVDRYLYTSYGPKAAKLLASIYLEKGEVRESLYWWEVLARLAPSGESFAYQAFCYFELREIERLKTLLQLVKTKYPEVTLQAGNKIVKLTTFISEYLTKLQKVTLNTTPDQNISSGGNFYTRLMGPEIEKIPPLAWKYKIPKLSFPLIRIKGDLASQIKLVCQNFPYINKGILYLATDTTLYAFNLIKLTSTEENLDKFVWKFEFPLEKFDYYEERVIHSPIVATDKVYVNLITSTTKVERPLDFWEFLESKHSLPNRGLFALSTQTGKIIWRVGGDEQGTNFLEKASFPISPIVEDNNLYCPVVYTKYQTDLPEYYLVSLDKDTGTLRWKTFIASGVLEINLFNNPARESLPGPLVLDQDNIYFSTNIGVIAACDKTTGTVKWVKRYTQYEIPPHIEIIPPRLPLNWVNNPPILWHNAEKNKSILLVTPIDSPYLYVLEPDSGRELWKWHNADLGGVCYIIGISPRGYLYLSGKKCVIALDLLKEGDCIWKFSASNPLLGKGALTEKAVYVTTERELIKLDAVTGKVINSWDWENAVENVASSELHTNNNDWGGNLLIWNNVLVTTSESQLNVFYDWEAIVEWTKQALKEKPNDPYLLQQLAEGYLKGRKKLEAIEVLKEALQKAAQLALSSSKAPELTKLMNSIKNSLYGNYQELAEEILKKANGGEKIPSEVFTYLQSAREYASTPEDFIAITIKLAKTYTQSGAIKEALKEYQTIIEKSSSEPNLAETALKTREVARSEIDRLIEKEGRHIYEELEQQAQQLYFATKDARKVWQVYPNSLIARQVLYELCECLFYEGKYETAIQTAREFVARYPALTIAGKFYWILVESYEKLKMFDSACEVLKLIVKEAQNIAANSLPEVKLDENLVKINKYAQDKLATSPYQSKD